jgi:hypothetical protein
LVVAIRVGPWELLDRRYKFKKLAGQGLTTVIADGQPTVLYRGDWSIPKQLRARGWVHIGDPGSWGGYVFDAYQGRRDARSKLYEVVTPVGDRYDYDHVLDATLDPPELFNNSFAAVSPDGQWIVSGEWGATKRLLVFPTPVLNPTTPPTGGDLWLAGTIELDRTVRNVQGAVFFDERTLLCATDDQGTDAHAPLWPVPRQLLAITLAEGLDTLPAPASVECVGSLPRPRGGLGASEVEGIDYQPTTGDLRVDIVPLFPLNQILTMIYRFRRR